MAIPIATLVTQGAAALSKVDLKKLQKGLMALGGGSVFGLGPALMAFGAGAALGVGAGMLVAPKSGSETRQQLRAVLNQALTSLKTRFHQIESQASTSEPQDSDDEFARSVERVGVGSA